MDTTRRRFVRIAAGSLPIAVAGCTGGGGGQEGDGDTTTATATATPTETATATATETDAETTTAAAGATVAVRSLPDLGDVLVDGEGMTLYMFENDTRGSGESSCTGGCLEAWPALAVDSEDAVAAADDVSAELATIERPDGTLQVTADGWPLYYYASDGQPGDATGQGVGNVWWVMRPDGTVVEPDLQVRSHEEYGDVLADSEGMTLYMFDNDTRGSGESSCTGGCLEAWPAFTVDGEPTAASGVGADLSTFDRSDGSTQVSAGGWPLYYYASDEEPGDATGQGVNGVWWVVAPDGTPIRSAATSTATATATPTDGGDTY